MKKKLSILIALVMAISLCLTPVVAQAADTYRTVDSMTIPTEITVDMTEDSVIWTIDIDMTDYQAFAWGEHIGYGLVISLDQVHPAFQIHGNDGVDHFYEFGTHLYSKWVEGEGWNGWLTGWNGSGDRAANNIPVTNLDWVEATGERDIADNPDGVFTITIDKAELGLEFYWAVQVMGQTSDTHYPEAWVLWSGVASSFETATIPEPGPTPKPDEPVLVRSPDAFDVFVRFGYDSTRYSTDGSLVSSIDVAGLYNDAQYRLEIPEGCVVTGATGRINWLWLDSIGDDVLSFVLEGDASFSEPCTLYITDGGRLYQDYWTGQWLGGGEWIEVGTFTEIVDGEATLD